MKLIILFVLMFNFLKADWEIFYFSDFVNDPNAGPTFQSIVMDGNNRIWIGFQKGLLMYENEIWTKFDESNTPLKYTLIRRLSLDKNSDLWAVTGFGNEYSSLIKYNEGNWLIYDKNNSLYDDMATQDIAIVNDNEYWLATQHGVYHFSTQGLKSYYEGSFQFHSININSNNELFTLSDTYFFKCDLNSNKIEFEKIPSSYNIRGNGRILVDKTDRIWLPSLRFEDGLILFENNNWTKFDSTNFENDEVKLNMHISENNDIYVSNNLGIYSYINDEWVKIANYPKELTDQLKYLTQANPRHGGIIGKDSEGNYWLSGSFYLIRFNPEKASVAQKSNVTIFPNPSQASITVTAEQAITSLALYSLNLSKIKDLTPNHTTTQEINISTLPAGVYFIKVNEEFVKFVRE